ncbi:MAG TPA: neocarzinostatin apoprotein domain-containing protein [Acidimicrobiia bacterium]|nr:neocarzinostatin apoprotein domain-containing protein [Acidimicrobiia bacterium]
MPTTGVVVLAVLALGAPGLASASAPFRVAAQADHPLGVLTRTFVDTSRPTPRNVDRPKRPERELETTIWYPATESPDASGAAVPDVGGGPYPLILFAHGYSATPGTYEDLLARIASAGYVVAAPRFPRSSGGGPHTPDAGDVVNQPGDLSFLIDELVAASRAEVGPLAGMIEPKAIGVAGHSNGGITVLGATAHSCCRDKRIKAVAVLSGTPAPFPGGDFTFAHLPSFLAIHGTADELVAYDDIVRTFNDARGPKVLLTVEGGDHGASASVDGPAGPSVLATITDFFDGYLRDDPAAIDRLPDDAEAGITSIVAATEPGSRDQIPIAPEPEYDRKVTVTPRRNLEDGDVVTVRWSGFSPDGVINVLQCGPDRSTGSAGCELTTAAILHPDPTGEGEVQLTIIEGPVGNTICDAKHPRCVIIANDDSSLLPEAIVEVPIHFRKASRS